MSLLRNLASGLRSLFRKEQVDRELDEELGAYLDMVAAEKMKQGLSREEALRAVRLERGSPEIAREVVRSGGWESLVETYWQDLRYAVRRLRLAPGFTATTVLTLALGIGATTSIFTLVYAVMLKSLAVANPSELYRLGKEARCCYWGGYSQENEFSLVSYELYKHFRENTKDFAELAAFQASKSLLGVRRGANAEPAQTAPGEFVSGNYFTMFGVGAYAGRALTPVDDQAGAPPVAVMSYRFWQEKYGSDPSVIGSVFNLDNKPFTVVGIAPPAFFGDTLRIDPPDFFLPLATAPLVGTAGDINQPDQYWLDLIGRVRRGVKPASIEAEMRVELKQWLRSHWGDMTANEQAKFPNQTLFLSPGGSGISSMREDYERWLEILLMISGFVLLIVCANVANLMVIRGMERRQQTSLSIALGAQTSRILRQPLTESILLALFGGAASLAIAFACTRLILHYAFPTFAPSANVPISASPSMPVLLFAFAISLVTGVAFGIGPAWMATRVDPMEALQGSNRSTTRESSLSRKTLVVFQAALSLVLLSAAGLLTAAWQKLEHQDFGFGQERRIIANINPFLAGYGPDQVTPLYQRIHDSISAIPGVSAAALCTYSPLGNNSWGGSVLVDGHPAPGPSDDNYSYFDRVTPGYFSVVGNPILRGRDISMRDTATSTHVAVINEAFARKFFKNEDPMGRHFGQHGIGSEREYVIVGIAKDARYLQDFAKPIPSFFFLPEAQHDFLTKPTPTDANPGSHFLHDTVILTAPGATLSDAQLRQTMASVDPNLPIISIHTLKDQVATHFTQQRLIARLTSLFGLLSLVLASIGLYGVTAYNVGRRRNEIGVRMALGANRGAVIRLVLRGAFLLIACGLILGLPLSLATSRVLSSQLYGLNPYDPILLATAVFILGLFGLMATLAPALRASSISPSQALRSE